MSPVQSKLFDKQFVASSLRGLYKCTKCGHCFEENCSKTKDRSFYNRPVLLPCGHNVCEDCIHRNRNSFKCSVCSKVVEFENKRYLRRCYDFNFTLLGQLINLKACSGGSAEHPPFGMFAEETFVQKCNECELSQAVGLCVFCKVNFCKRCFMAVHKHSKVLKQHVLTEFVSQAVESLHPQPTVCSLHQRMCDKYCNDCHVIVCFICVKKMHNLHKTCPLSTENAKHTEKIISFLETMKDSKACLSKAQQEARSCEHRLNDFATRAVIDVNNFFARYHNFLQLEERRILDEFKEYAQPIKEAIFAAITQLGENQTILNNIKSMLQTYVQDPPQHYHIHNIIDSASEHVDKLRCNFHITEFDENPFQFKTLKDIEKDIIDAYEFKFTSPNIAITLTPMNGDTSQVFEISSGDMTKLDLGDEVARIEQSGPVLTKKTRLPYMYNVRITHIVGPLKFFIQDYDTGDIIQSQIEAFQKNPITADEIELNHKYMVYKEEEDTWYRGLVKEEYQKDTDSSNTGKIYKVLLIDYGVEIDVSDKWFRQIPKQLQTLSKAAHECCLKDIRLSDENGLNEARALMEEIIQNQPVTIYVEVATVEPWVVGVLVEKSKENISLRDALIYTGLCVENAPGKGPMRAQTSKIRNRITRKVLSGGLLERVEITHPETPHQFFAVKFSRRNNLIKFNEELNDEHNEAQQVYVGQLYLPCVISLNSVWHRGRIEGINGPKEIRIRLVDNGRTVTVDWRQVFALKEKFLSVPEYAIECSLIDIQPLQENDYDWTESAIAEFRRMTLNPVIQMNVISCKRFRHQVVLIVAKNTKEINVGAMLVELKHAITTGENSAHVEVLDKKEPLRTLTVPENVAAVSSKEEHVERTPIEIINVRSPGEFYVYITEYIPRIKKLQHELQDLQQSKKWKKLKQIDWAIDSHCMVLGRLNKSDSKQWYRGIIVDILGEEPECSYSVFLRDKGQTLYDIPKQQLTPIDASVDKVANGAIRCHLACIDPPLDEECWSFEAVDEFKHLISQYNEFCTVIHGSTKNSSIPIILWGVLIDNDDPLAPSKVRYENINKMLIKSGAARKTGDMIILLKKTSNQSSGGPKLLNFSDQNTFELAQTTGDTQESDDPKFVNKTDDKSQSIQSKDNFDKWLPPKPIELTTFSAYLTNINDEAIAYLHDSSNHQLLTEMKDKIQQLIAKEPPSDDSEQTWSLGEPCFARYYVDSLWYRALIISRLSPTEFNVQFVDYGNIERCTVSELSKAISFTDIPIQAVPYKIIGVATNSDTDRFPASLLDKIYGSVVGKLCDIRVPQSELGKQIKKCSIYYQGIDVADYLIRNGSMSSAEGDNDINPIEKTSKENSIVESSSSEHRSTEVFNIQPTESVAKGVDPDVLDLKMQNPEMAIHSTQEYEQIYENLQKAKLLKDVETAFRVSASCASGSVSDDEEVVKSFSDNDYDLTRRPQSTKPPHDLHMSTKVFFAGLEVFPGPFVPISVKEFECEIVFVVSPLVLHVFPTLCELEYRQCDLDRRIETIVPSMKRLKTFVPKTPCLAMYSEDKRWYRAVIKSHDAAKKCVTIFYVDFLNSETVSERSIKECPPDLLTLPRRTLEVKLFGVAPNPNNRIKDVKNAVTLSLKNSVLYAKVVREVNGIKEVILSQSKARQDVCALENLISMKYLCKKKDLKKLKNGAHSHED